MGFLKRLAFYCGLILGLLTIAAAGTVALTYLFTGKFASVEMAEGKAEVTLMTKSETRRRTSELCFTGLPPWIFPSCSAKGAR